MHPNHPNEGGMKCSSLVADEYGSLVPCIDNHARGGSLLQLPRLSSGVCIISSLLMQLVGLVLLLFFN